jgi:hypothetical protein
MATFCNKTVLSITASWALRCFKAPLYISKLASRVVKSLFVAMLHNPK